MQIPRTRGFYAAVVIFVLTLVQLAVGWELGEWYTFIRRGTELDGAYEDTLSDELLGTLGALIAALIVGRKHKADKEVEDVASVV